MNNSINQQPAQENKHVSFSQNFLRSTDLVRELIKKTSLNKNDVVYEIGPGRGIITAKLSKTCGKVVAIEADKELYTQLQQKFPRSTNVDLHYGDFLQYKLPNATYKVFSNIPFNITADIIRKLTEAYTLPQEMYLFMQADAAKKFIGTPLASETQFSVLLKPWFVLDVLHNFKQIDFTPVPRVEIVLVRIVTRTTPLVLVSNKNLYNDFITYSFSRWKSTLQEGLKEVFTYIQFSKLSQDLQFSMKATPTQLTFEQWLGLFTYFLIGVDKPKKRLVMGAHQKKRKQQAGVQKIHRTRTKQLPYHHKDM